MSISTLAFKEFQERLEKKLEEAENSRLKALIGLAIMLSRKFPEDSLKKITDKTMKLYNKSVEEGAQ